MNKILTKLKKYPKTQYARHLIQLISFILMPGLVITTFSSIRILALAIYNNTFSISNNLQEITYLTVIMLTSMFWGRFFCGFVCSFGAFQDALRFIFSGLVKRPIKVNKKLDYALKLLKFGILIFIAGIVWTGVIKFNNISDPWTIFGIYSSPSAWKNLSYWATLGGVSLILISIASIYIERFFCRYLCPLGAIFTVISKLRLFNIRKPISNCGPCSLCSYKCCMGIDLRSDDIVSSGECIDCMLCENYCPKENISTTGIPAVAGTITSVAMLGLCYCGNIAVKDGGYYDIGLQEVLAATEATGKYADGVYEGEAPGFRGSVKVKTTVSNGIISDISLISTDDDGEFFNKAWNSLIPKIVSSQDVNVTSVSGATFSSVGIIEAVANSLGDAAIGDVIIETPKREEILKEADKPKTSEAEKAEVPKILNEVQNTDGYADGVYSGIGNGYNGNISVNVTVSNGLISDITLVNTNDDNEFFSEAWSGVVPQIISSQKAGVSFVSGATFSSYGIMEAVANALGSSISNIQKPSQPKVQEPVAPLPTEEAPQTPIVTDIPEAINTPEGQLTDGVYTGSGNGFRGNITVSVTVANGAISDITLVNTSDDDKYFNRAWSTVTSNIISSQSPNVTGVSGATFSSYGIMEAVANALGGQLSNNTSPKTSEIPINPTIEKPQEQVINPIQGQLTDGVYTGVGTGFRGNTTVSVTVTNGAISDITLVDYMDDDKYFNRAWSTVIESIISNQSVSVPTVSGATFSSNGIMEAVSKALGQGFENPNSTMERGKHGHDDHGDSYGDYENYGRKKDKKRHDH